MFGLESLVKVMESLDSKALHVNPRQCSRLRHRLSKCRLCADYCPTQAISWGESLEVDADKCTGCGICANACPNGVFMANEPTNDALLSQAKLWLKDNNQIAFLCAKFQQKTRPGSIRAGTFLRINCMGQVDESLLVGCVALGAESVWLIDTLCRKCEYQSGRAIAQPTVAAANAILGIFGVPERVFISSKLPEWMRGDDSSSDLDGDLYARRDFLLMAAQRAKRTASVAITSIVESHLPDNGDKPDKSNKGLPFHLPRKRMLLLHFMRRLGEPTGATARLGGLPFCQLKVNSSCTICGMCAFFCPTSALRMADEEGGGKAVTFQLSHCTSCNLCQEICYKEAITALPEADPRKLTSKKEDTLFVGEPSSFLRPIGHQLHPVGPQELEG